MHLRLLSVAASKALEVDIDDEATVDDLKQKVDYDARTKRIRFIFEGKLVDNGNARLSDYKIRDGSILHMALSELKPSPVSEDSPRSARGATSSDTHVVIEAGNSMRSDEHHRIVFIPRFRAVLSNTDFATLRAVASADDEEGFYLDEETLRALEEVDWEEHDHTASFRQPLNHGFLGCSLGFLLGGFILVVFLLLVPLSLQPSE